MASTNRERLTGDNIGDNWAKQSVQVHVQHFIGERDELDAGSGCVFKHNYGYIPGCTHTS